MADTVPTPRPEAIEAFADMLREVEEVRDRAAMLESMLQRERDAHSATKKELAASRAREAKLKASLERKGPIDAVEERWLQNKRASVDFVNRPGRAGVKLSIPRFGQIWANTLDEALEKAHQRGGGTQTGG